MSAASPVLAVDLDGTLLKTDTLYELMLRLVKQQPLQFFYLPWVALLCLSRGKQYLKQYLADRVSLDPSLLPYNREFLAYLHQQHQAGRQLVLATGCHTRVAQAIAQHLAIFSRVLATDAHCNMTGNHKAKALVESYGKAGFDYAGNSSVDQVVWESCREKILVNASASLRRSLQARFAFAHVFDEAKWSAANVFKGLRLHQWAKNALIFLPALTAHAFWKNEVLVSLLLAFIAFGCCASFSYVVNDLLDLDDDRKHHRKKYRPFAAADISIAAALSMAIVLLAAALMFALSLPLRFFELLVLYFVVTNLYSFRLKQIPVLDVAVLAGLYTLRVLAGAVVIRTDPTFWLIAFSAFLFFGLAIVKRLSELLHLQKQGRQEVKARGYIAEDISTLQGLGASSAIAAVLVLALYINSDSVRTLYQSPNQLWLLCPALLLWLGRVWLITGRGQMHDDPVVFALKDRLSWLILLACVSIMVSATYF